MIHSDEVGKINVYTAPKTTQSDAEFSTIPYVMLSSPRTIRFSIPFDQFYFSSIGRCTARIPMPQIKFVYPWVSLGQLDHLFLSPGAHCPFHLNPQSQASCMGVLDIKIIQFGQLHNPTFGCLPRYMLPLLSKTSEIDPQLNGSKLVKRFCDRRFGLPTVRHGYLAIQPNAQALRNAMLISDNLVLLIRW